MSTCIICQKTIKGKNIDHYINKHGFDVYTAKAYAIKNEKAFRELSIDAIVEYLKHYEISAQRKERNDQTFSSFYTTIVKFRPYNTITDTNNFFSSVIPWREKNYKNSKSYVLADIYFPNEPEMRIRYKEYIKSQNPFTGHDANLSPFSENFIGYNKLTEEEKKKTIRTITKRGDKAHIPTQIQYWIKKGFSEAEAKEKVHARQQTFSKEICIKKYGEEKGQQVWLQRQIKWLSNYKKQNYSKISQDLFWNVYERIKNNTSGVYFATMLNGNKINNNENHEKVMSTGIGTVKLDFVVESAKSVIEFDGDYWHGEKRGNQKRDSIRTKAIEDIGYKVLHIKERDYNNNKDAEIKKCVEFIYENQRFI